MCAGVTMYNSLRNTGARAGDIVAVAGVGGLGHLGVQVCTCVQECVCVCACVFVRARGWGWGARPSRRSGMHMCA